MVCKTTHSVNESPDDAPSLWPHQIAAVDATLSAIQGGRDAGLIVEPTGTGKTAFFATVARRLGWPAVVLVHRDEWDDSRDVVIASVQSLPSKRLERMPGDRFRLLIADEAHHSVAPTWQAVIEHFGHEFLLGCTATPDRTDRKGLAAV